MFRDWLRAHAGEAVMAYNLRKQPIIREILDRMFTAHGMR